MSRNCFKTEAHDCDKEHPDMTHDEWEASQDTPADEQKEEPTNATGASVVGTGDDSSTVVKKKKKKKTGVYKRLKSTRLVGQSPDKELVLKKEERNYRKEYDNYHKQPEQRKRNAGRLRARRLMVKLGKVTKGDKKDVHHKDNDPINNEKGNLSVTTQKYNRTEPRLRENDAVVVQPNITPDSQFAGVDVFNVGSNEFNSCKFGKKKHARWNDYIDTESDIGKRIYGYAKKNPMKSIIVQHDKTGHMLYLRKYAKTDGTKSGIMVKKGTKKC